MKNNGADHLHVPENPKLKEKVTAFLLKLNFSMLNYCVKRNFAICQKIIVV